MPAKTSSGYESRFLRFTHFQKLVGVNVVQGLPRSRRPGNFYFRIFCGPESEMKTLVARGNITSGGSGESGLPVDPHASSESVAVARVPRSEIVSQCCLPQRLKKTLRRTTERRHHHVLRIHRCSNLRVLLPGLRRETRCLSPPARTGHRDSSLTRAVPNSAGTDRSFRHCPVRGLAQQKDPSFRRYQSLPARCPSRTSTRQHAQPGFAGWHS